MSSFEAKIQKQGDALALVVKQGSKEMVFTEEDADDLIRALLEVKESRKIRQPNH